MRLLLAWTGAINLTAIRDPLAVVTAHVVDSLTAVDLLRQRGAATILDLGSGGGYPGLPLAIALPARRACLVESVGKKAAFLATAVAALGLEHVEVAATRAEALAHDPAHRGQWAAVVCRAVAALDDLVEVALPLVQPGGVLVAWKQVPLDEELAAARDAIRSLGGAAPDVIPIGLPGLERHRLVVVEARRPAPPGFPRDPAARRRARGRR